MLNQLYKQLQENDLMPVGSKLLLAVSGGVDSVTMLHLLDNLKDVYGWKLAVAHYNHGVRPDATKDALLVGKLAEEYGLPYYIGKYEYTDYSEAALRKARYGFLEELRKDIGYDYVVTAHHNNDLIETAIFNTIRGADREGMVALKPRRGNILRPLLNFSKPEIIVFANLQNLPYREDSTNSDLSYSRNFVRNVLVPHASVNFKSFHHNMNKRLDKLTDLNRRINTGLSRLAESIAVFEGKDSIQVNTVEFNNLPDQLKPSLLVYMIKRLMPAHKLSRKNVIMAVDFIASTKAGAKMELPGGLHLVNTYDTFVITSRPEEFNLQLDDSLYVLNSEKPFANDFFELRVSPSDKSPIRVPEQKLYVRYRQAGDRVQPVGMEGSKKLQDVFVDAKVPKHLRDLWPVVVTAGNEIVWVPQLVKDRRFFDTQADKYQFLSCEVK
jgi:tRNA(Ile)-lysidine synthase